MAAKESGITSFLMTLVFALFIGFIATALTQVMKNGAVGVAPMPVIFSYIVALWNILF